MICGQLVLCLGEVITPRAVVPKFVSAGVILLSNLSFHVLGIRVAFVPPITAAGVGAADVDLPRHLHERAPVSFNLLLLRSLHRSRGAVINRLFVILS